MIHVTLPDGAVQEFPAGITPKKIAENWQDRYDSPIAEAIVNGVGMNLRLPLDRDCTLDFLPINCPDGMRAYVRSLLFLFLVSAEELYPDIHVEVRNSLGTALYCVTHGGRYSEEMLRDIEKRMREYIDRKEPIQFLLAPRKLAIDDVLEDSIQGQDRIGLLEMRPDLERFPSTSWAANTSSSWNRCCRGRNISVPLNSFRTKRDSC